MSITKVVIPAAGLGTRFLPITKSIPKEMLPILNKPALQYIVEEGIDSGINHFCMVVSEAKGAIKDFFSPNQKLAAELDKAGKSDWTHSIDRIINQAQFSYVLQPEMRGLADAILKAEQLIKPQEYFSVILPDDMLFADEPGIKQLINIAQREHAAVIAVIEVPMEEIGAYGCIKIKQTISEDLVEIEDIIEKPKPEEAFSNLAISGRYVLPHDIFEAIKSIEPKNGELQFTDAIVHLAKKGHKLLAYKIKGKRFDTGRPAGWLAANKYAATL